MSEFDERNGILDGDEPRTAAAGNEAAAGPGAGEEPAHAADTTALGRYGPSELAAAPDSLPVLRAFQDFIEEERVRSKRRMVAMAVFFLVILAAVVAGGLVAGSAITRRVRNDVRRVEDEVRQQTDRIRDEAHTVVAQVAGQTRELVRRLDAERDDLSTAQTNLAGRVERYGGQIAGLKEVIDMLEAESAAVKNHLDALSDRMPPQTAAYAPSTGIPAAAAPAPAPEPPGVPRRSTVDLAIIPAGATKPVSWRMPIPE